MNSEYTAFRALRGEPEAPAAPEPITVTELPGYTVVEGIPPADLALLEPVAVENTDPRNRTGRHARGPRR